MGNPRWWRFLNKTQYNELKHHRRQGHYITVKYDRTHPPGLLTCDVEEFEIWCHNCCLIHAWTLTAPYPSLEDTRKYYESGHG